MITPFFLLLLGNDHMSTFSLLFNMLEFSMLNFVGALAQSEIGSKIWLRIYACIYTTKYFSGSLVSQRT